MDSALRTRHSALNPVVSSSLVAPQSSAPGPLMQPHHHPSSIIHHPARSSLPTPDSAFKSPVVNGLSSVTLNSQLSTLNCLRGLRICLLAGTLGQGGAERQLSYIASALKSSGAEVLVLTVTSGEVWESRLQAIGVPVQFVGASASRLKRLLAVARAVKRFRPTLVQSQHFYMNSYASLVARLFRLHAIGAVRGDGFFDLRDCGRLGKLCLNLPHKLAVNSRAAIRNLTSLGCHPERLHHFPNVIDLARFPLGHGMNGSPATILGVGRFTAEKRFDRFLRVIALLKQRSGAAFRVTIAGDGPLRLEMEKLARSLGLSDTVKFCGDVPDIQSLYRQAHILLFTSDYEGTPNVVMEALASGLSVVATAVGDVPDLIQDGSTGFLVEPNDESALADRLKVLLQDRSLRSDMSRRGRAFVETHHSLDLLPAQLEALYRAVLVPSPHPMGRGPG